MREKGGVAVQADVPCHRFPILIHPRNVGEILDDAWRLYLSHLPLFLALSSLFTVPAAVALLLLLTQPQPENWLLRPVLPALTAVLFCLTGLGSGACQHALRLVAEGKALRLGACLWGAARRGPDHVAARGVLLAAASLGVWLLVLPAVAFWIGATVIHPMLASGEVRLFAAMAMAAREAPRHAGKALVVTLCRLPLFGFALLNLSMLLQGGLWIAGNFAGLDTALAQVLLSLSNPACLLALVLLTWILLAPFAEASNFLLHADARARFEGLDLWYRVQHLFPLAEKSRAGAVLLALGAALLLAVPVRAAAKGEAERLENVRSVRRQVEVIRGEIERVSPYPGGNRWLSRLHGLAHVLDPASSESGGPYRWFHQALEGFGARSQEGAMQVLTSLGRRLEIVEQSLDQPAEEGEAATPGRSLSRDEIRGLVPKRSEAPTDSQGEPHTRQGDTRREVRRQEVRRDEDQPGQGGRAPREGPGIVPAQPGFALGQFAWMTLAGLLLAILVVTGVLLWQHRDGRPKTSDAPQAGKTPSSLESLLSQPQPQTSAALWRQAEQLAAKGEHLQAVRLLYASVLAHLHRANLIGYEVMRTNGEYVSQLLASAQAPEEAQEPFERLTELFEVRWYGERGCRAEDYDECRGLTERIRGLV